MRYTLSPPMTPPGWEPYAAELIRLCSAEGTAVAWLWPAVGGSCVGFAVRRASWMPVLHVESPVELQQRPSRSGCAVLFPFPGHVRNMSYRWVGVDHILPALPGSTRSYVHGFARFQRWRVKAQRDDYAELELPPPHRVEAQQAGYPFPVRLQLTLRLVDTTLMLHLAAKNEGEQSAPVGLGLHPYFTPTLFGCDRTEIRAVMSGDTEHILVDAIPTGARRHVMSTLIVPPPLGMQRLLAYTNFMSAPTVTLKGRDDHPYVHVTMDGCRDLLFYAPDDRPSVAIEPHSCAPGAASQPEGHPDGLIGLAPGATQRLKVAITVVDV